MRRIRRKLLWVIILICLTGATTFIHTLLFIQASGRCPVACTVSAVKCLPLPSHDSSAIKLSGDTGKTKNETPTGQVPVLSAHGTVFHTPGPPKASRPDAPPATSTTSNVTIIAGRARENKAFLVIGIPTAHRRKANYLTDSLQDLMQGLTKSEKQEVLFVIFATDSEEVLRQNVVATVGKWFGNELNSGVIQIIEAPKSLYPMFFKVPRLWNDKPERVRWRSKQCIDYAILFQYCSELGSFYLQLEDDISVDAGYLKIIKSFIEYNKNETWSVLEFGARGFIGMLYRASNLKRLSQFVKMYYWIWPVDMLFRQFNDFSLHGNPSYARLKKPLFRHVGAISTLENQSRILEDVAKMNRVKRLYKDADNPPAQITTTISSHYGPAGIMETYRKTDKHGCFWGKDVKLEDSISVIFEKPIIISKVVIETGGNQAPEDIIGEAILFRSSEKQGACGSYEIWERYTNSATLNARGSVEKEDMLVKCLRLTVTKLRRDKHARVRWLRILEIAVWIRK